MQGKIVKIISNDYTVQSNNNEFVCKSRGKFRNLNITPLVGDLVIFDENNNYILEILPRTNELIRPPVSNIDQAFIITSVKDPNFSPNLLDKLLTVIEFNSIKPIIVFTKFDLLSKKEENEIQTYVDYYESLNYKIFKNNEIELIKNEFNNKVSVFTGQSGAGKSTLLNKLDPKLNIKTDEISYALGRGKHTTRHVELIKINDGLVADTPGFSSIDFNSMTNSDIRDQFVEFNRFKENCKYKDCMHLKEDECAIKKEIEKGNIISSRYESYLNFINNNSKPKW
ncbi:MAG: ribosome small subunit-dependent GTPase A [Bacilli bacterium]